MLRPARNNEIERLEHVFIGFPSGKHATAVRFKKNIKPLFNCPGFMHLIAAHVI